MGDQRTDFARQLIKEALNKSSDQGPGLKIAPTSHIRQVAPNEATRTQRANVCEAAQTDQAPETSPRDGRADHGLNRFCEDAVHRACTAAPPTQRFDELLSCLDVMGLAGSLAQDLAQHDPFSDGEGAHRLGDPAVLEAIETAAQGQ